MTISWGADWNVRCLSPRLHSPRLAPLQPQRLSGRGVSRLRVHFDGATSSGALNYEMSRHHAAPRGNFPPPPGNFPPPRAVTPGRLEPPCGPLVGKEDTCRHRACFRSRVWERRGGTSAQTLSVFSSDVSSTPSEGLPSSAELLQRILISNERGRLRNGVLVC